MLNSKEININNFDNLVLEIYPDKNNSGTELSIEIITSNKSFFYNKYNLKLGQTNYISIDLRDAKYSSKTKNEELRLDKVKGVGVYI